MPVTEAVPQKAALRGALVVGVRPGRVFMTQHGSVPGHGVDPLHVLGTPAWLKPSPGQPTDSLCHGEDTGLSQAFSFQSLEVTWQCHPQKWRRS